MPYVIAAPEVLTSTGTDLATIGSNLSAAHAAAATPTVALVPAAADEVSASIAHLFSRYAKDYQARAAHAVAFQEQFVQNLAASARSYADTEAANAAVLQPLTAIAGPFSSAIPTLSGQILDLLNSAIAFVGQLLNSLINSLLPLIAGGLAYLTNFFFLYVLPVINLVLSFLVIL